MSISFNSFLKITNLSNSDKLKYALKKEKLIDKIEFKEVKRIYINKKALNIVEYLVQKYNLTYKKEQKPVFLYLISNQKGSIKFGISKEPINRFNSLYEAYKEKLGVELKLLWISQNKSILNIGIEKQIHSSLKLTQYTNYPPIEIDGMSEWYKKDVITFIREYLKLFEIEFI